MSLSASVEPLPSRVTVSPVATFWSTPALATGGVLAVMITVSGALSTVPSLTTNWASYVPARSATKEGLAVLPPDRAAVLVAGTVVSDQLKVKVSLSASVEPLPSRVTVSPVATFWSVPALATGGMLIFTCPSTLVAGRMSSPFESVKPLMVIARGVVEPALPAAANTTSKMLMLPVGPGIAVWKPTQLT